MINLHKNFFTNNFIVHLFMFIIGIISVITTMIILYTFCVNIIN